MNRLTHERVNGIKTGYWSPGKKQDLVDRLAEYEDTGLTPEQVRELAEKQKPMKPEMGNMTTICPECAAHWKRYYEYCPDCGQKIAWED